MPYCVCVLNDDPEKCSVWVRRGDHMGWNGLNIKSMGKSVSSYSDNDEAQKIAHRMSEFGIEATVESWNDLVDMIPRNNDGSYLACNCEECRGRSS